MIPSYPKGQKKVTLPTKHNPGPGKPTEYLAYMTPEEAEMLRVLTDGTVSRGPKGVPSFVLGGFGTSGSGTYSSTGTKTGTTTGSTSGSSSVSRISGGTAGSNASNYGSGSSSWSGSGGSGSGTSSVSRISGGTAGSNASNYGTNSSSWSGGSGSVARSSTPSSPSSPNRVSQSATGSGQIGSKGGGASAQQPGGVGQRTGVVSKSDLIGMQGYNEAGRAMSLAALDNSGPTQTNAQKMRQQYSQYRSPPGAAPLKPTTGPGGPFGAPGYTGPYNPENNTYGLANRPAAAPIGIDPSMPGRLAEANKNYRTVTGPGGNVARVYADPDVRAPTLGDTVSGYAQNAADALGGFFSGPAPPGLSLAQAQQQLDAYRQSLNPPAKQITDRVPQTSPTSDYNTLLQGVSPYTTGDMAIENAIRQGPNVVDENFARARAERMTSMGLANAFDPPASVVAASRNPLSSYGTAPKITDRVPQDLARVTGSQTRGLSTDDASPGQLSYKAQAMGVTDDMLPGSHIDPANISLVRNSIGVDPNKYSVPIGPQRPPSSPEADAAPLNSRTPLSETSLGRYGTEGATLPPGYRERYMAKGVLGGENLIKPAGGETSLAPSQQGSWPGDVPPSQREPLIDQKSWPYRLAKGAFRLGNAIVPGLGTGMGKAMDWDANRINQMSPAAQAELQDRWAAQNKAYLAGNTSESRGRELDTRMYNGYLPPPPLLDAVTGATPPPPTAPAIAPRRRVGNPVDPYNYGYGPGFNYFNYDV